MSDKIEGIPEGYELVRIGTPKQGEPYLTPKGRIEICEGGFHGTGYAVLRKIEKIERCRPFANAAEFEPNKDRWILNATIDDPGAVGMSKITAFDDEGVTLRGSFYFTYEELFELDIRFDNNQPFGIEVTE